MKYGLLIIGLLFAVACSGPKFVEKEGIETLDDVNRELGKRKQLHIRYLDGREIRFATDVSIDREFVKFTTSAGPQREQARLIDAIYYDKRNSAIVGAAIGMLPGIALMASDPNSGLSGGSPQTIGGGFAALGGGVAGGFVASRVRKWVILYQGPIDLYLQRGDSGIRFQ